MIKRLTILISMISLIYVLAGCSIEESEHNKMLEGSDLDYIYESIQLFIKDQDKDLTIIKDNDSNLLTIVDSSITPKFISSQRTAIKLNGYKAIKYKWDQENKLLLSKISNYKKAMNTLGYDFNIALLRCDKDLSKKYYYALNEEIVYDNLFDNINFQK